MKTTNLIAVAFAIGYFGSEFLPTIANVATVDTAAAGRMIAAFGLAQVVGLLFFGFLADRAKPLPTRQNRRWTLSARRDRRGDDDAYRPVAGTPG